jgi:prophage antirepressor-like protein
MQQISVYDFDDKSLSVYGESEEPWFRAREVLDFLGYSKESRPYKDYKKAWIKVRLFQSTLGGPQKTTFINEPALYKLIMSSNKPEAERFSDWVVSSVLPSIRKTGKYDVKEDKTLALDTFNAVSRIFELYGADDRDKLFLKDCARNLISGSETNGEEKEISISKRIMDLKGISAKRKDLIRIGQLVASKYTDVYGEKPMKREQFVDGTVRNVNHYTSKHYEKFIDSIINDYYCC